MQILNILLMKRILFLLIFLNISDICLAKEINSKFNFKFNLPDSYQIINSLNLYDVYNQSHKDPLKQKQINRFKQILQKKDIELLYNFKQSPFNNISILVFDNNYKVNKKKVLNQCKKILKNSMKYGGKKVDLIECRMHSYPKFADWSMYRENKSSFFENELTQQIIFQYKKKEYVITVACVEKCNLMKSDLFKLVETIKF
tara:strand:+ start:1377 stop:1979 length:603 start_codon:yes stop_codon:yes gene_type:complete